MIELKITVDNINYSELINAIIPHIVSNKLAQRTLTAAINAKFNSMSETEKNHAAASFLNDNSSKISEILNSYIEKEQLGCNISDFSAKSI